MPSLRAVQQRLAAEILGNASGTPTTDAWLAGTLQLPPGVDADSRLAIYRDGYPARILEALQDAFPAIANICGDGSFATLVGRYLLESKLAATSLNGIGEQFPAHCGRDELSAGLPFLPDLAQLEWAALRALHSTDLRPTDPAIFGTWSMDDWERVTLTFQPSTQLIHSQWPIHDLWGARDVPRDEIDIDLSDRGQTILIYRRGYDVECRAVDESEAALFESLKGGTRLGASIERLTENEAAAADISGTFSQWLATGLITSATLT